MSRYDPLKLYLTNIHPSHLEVALSFKEVEEILDNSLSPSAHDHRPWCGNDYSKGTNSQAWIEAGLKVDTVDMKEEWIRFIRA